MRNIQTEEISFSHAAKIGRLLEMTHNDSSAYAFPSLFIWQSAMGLRVAFSRDCFAIKCARCGDNAWFFPVGEAEDCRAFLAEHMEEPDFSLHYVTEEQLALLQQWFPGCFHAEETPDDAEYICDIEQHMSLPGKAYSNVRRQLHKANKKGAITLTPLLPEDITYAQTVLRQWQCSGKDHYLSDDAELLTLQYAEHLHMELYFARLDGRICGVIGGFPLSGDSFDLCVGKEIERLQGLSYAVKRLFFEKLRGRYRYVNMEEDLGIPGLRVMKRSLVPVRMINMWEVRFRHEA